MDRVRLFPMELPRTNNVRGRISFIKRLGLCCIVLVCLGLLYVPAYHSAGTSSGIGETSSSGGPLGLLRYLESGGMHYLYLITTFTTPYKKIHFFLTFIINTHLFISKLVYLSP